MIERTKTWIWGLLLVWPIILLPAGVQGAECLEASPTIQAGKDPYLPVNVRELTPIEQRNVKSLLTSLDGEWQGHAEDVYCRDIRDPDDKDINRYTAKAKVEVDYYGNFYIQVDLYLPEKKTTHKEVLRLYLTQKKLRVNSSSGYGDIELIKVSQTSVAFLYRLLLNLENSKGSSRKEYFVSLNGDRDQLSIRQRIYSQGRLSYQQRWDLSRR